MPRHKPLRALNVNMTSRKELSNDTKSRIYGRALGGQSSYEIALEENIKLRSVYRVIKTTSERGDNFNTPKSGRPKVHSSQDDRSVVRNARLNPKFTYEDLARETDVDFSRDTVRSILRDVDISNWRSKKRPALQ